MGSELESRFYQERRTAAERVGSGAKATSMAILPPMSFPVTHFFMEKRSVSIVYHSNH
jgi:hypothetical protein